jgi:hypothetical protein
MFYFINSEPFYIIALMNIIIQVRAIKVQDDITNEGVLEK